MFSFEKLCLEEALMDSPQMQNFKQVFEEDATKLKLFATELQGSLHSLHLAHVAMGDALQKVVAVMKKIGSKEYPLDRDDGRVKETVANLCEYIDDINSQLTIQATEITDVLLNPVETWLSGDFEALTHNHRLLGIIEEQLESSLQNYMRLPRHCSEKQHHECVTDVYQMRRKYHNTALLYYSLLNQLQYRRYSVPLHILCNLMVALRGFHQRSWETLQRPDLVTQLENAGALVNSLRDEDSTLFQESTMFRRSVDQQATPAYFPETPGMVTAGGSLESENFSLGPPCLTLKQTSGYLFLRLKPTGLLTTPRWQKAFFFTQAGNLMMQVKGKVAGSPLIDLTEGGVYGEPADVDDRRNVFQIICPVSKKTIVLQAENTRDRDQWIATIMNISLDGGVTSNRPESRKVSASSPSMNSPSHPMTTSQTSAGTGEGVKAFLTNVFHRSTSSGNGSSNGGITASPTASPSLPQVKATTQSAVSTRQIPPNSRAASLMVDKLVAWFENQPIAFELIEQHFDEPVVETEVSHDGEGSERKNPFSATTKFDREDGTSIVLPCSPNATMLQTFSVQFLGAVEVPNEKDARDIVMTEATRYILDNRIQHEMFQMSHLLLVVCSEGIWLLDESSGLVKRYLSPESVSYSSSYHENKRYFGMLTTTRQPSRASSYYCYALECGSAELATAAIRNLMEWKRDKTASQQQEGDSAVADFEKTESGSK